MNWLTGFHDPIGGTEDPLRVLLRQLGALQPALDVLPALCLAGQVQQRAQQVVRDIIKGNATATQAAVIQQLNPVIRGWAMYHRHAGAKATFSLIDTHIWRMLWRWSVRRHPTKGARWVIRRYFRQRVARSWAFATKSAADGTTVGLQVFRASTVAVTRHVKVPGAAHPFDPGWTEYLARRRAAQRSVKLFGATPWC